MFALTFDAGVANEARGAKLRTRVLIPGLLHVTKTQQRYHGHGDVHRLFSVSVETHEPRHTDGPALHWIGCYLPTVMSVQNR